MSPPLGGAVSNKKDAGAGPAPEALPHSALHHRRRHRKVVHRDLAPDHARVDFITHGAWHFGAARASVRCGRSPRPLCTSGYRVGEDVWTAACGLFTLHNETLNVWTHLLGLVWFSAELPWVLERVQAHGGGWADTLCFALFIGCAQFQMFARWGWLY